MKINTKAYPYIFTILWKDVGWIRLCILLSLLVCVIFLVSGKRILVRAFTVLWISRLQISLWLPETATAARHGRTNNHVPINTPPSRHARLALAPSCGRAVSKWSITCQFLVHLELLAIVTSGF